jgi:predicted CoA-binding protein
MDWREALIRDDAGLVRIFREARTIAVLGAKGEPGEPAFYVPSYLKARGYQVFPVNPTRAGERILGEKVAATLAELPGPVDVVEVFRRPRAKPALEVAAPRCIWTVSIAPHMHQED